MDLEKICNEVCILAKSTGSFIRNERKVFSSSSIELKGRNDLVSYVDKTAEEMLVAGLSALLPGSTFITEENTAPEKIRNKKGDASLCWIIDPLDGTTNFIHGVPCYCISIALMKENKIIVGVVYEINLDECFYAHKNGGAFLNGTKINVSEIDKLENGLLATGFPYSNYSRMKEYMEVFNHFMHNTHGLRRLGSAAVDLAYVACGRFEGFYEYGLNSWDVAAGAFLVQEAGGTVTDFKSEEDFIFGREIVACNRNVHSEMLNIIKEKFTRK